MSFPQNSSSSNSLYLSIISPLENKKKKEFESHYNLLYNLFCKKKKKTIMLN